MTDTYEVPYNPPYKDLDLEPQNATDGITGRLVLSKEEQDMVVRMAEIGCSIDEICTILGKPQNRKTLTKWYSELLEYGKFLGNNRLRRVQFRKAIEGDTKMLMFLGRHRLGQVDNTEVNKEVLPWTD